MRHPVSERQIVELDGLEDALNRSADVEDLAPVPGCVFWCQVMRLCDMTLPPDDLAIAGKEAAALQVGHGEVTDMDE
jgi:hypothetical protein